MLNAMLASDNELKASYRTKMYTLTNTIEIIVTVVEYIDYGARLRRWKVRLSHFLANDLGQMVRLLQPWFPHL